MPQSSTDLDESGAELAPTAALGRESEKLVGWRAI
jgi:hypothetical protein